MRKICVLIPFSLILSFSVQASLVMGNSTFGKNVSSSGRIILNTKMVCFCLSEPELYRVFRYIHGPMVDEHLAMISFDPETRKPETHFFHQDERQSVLATTDINGQIVGKWTERSFGQRMPIKEFATPYGFTGREFEEKLGLNFHRARFYDPVIGRFISRDPVFGDISNPITQHPYIYGNLSPFRFVDPWGLEGVAYITFGSDLSKFDRLIITPLMEATTQLVKIKGYQPKFMNNPSNTKIYDIIENAKNDIWIHFGHETGVGFTFRDGLISAFHIKTELQKRAMISSRESGKDFDQSATENQEYSKFMYIYNAGCYTGNNKHEAEMLRQVLQATGGDYFGFKKSIRLGIFTPFILMQMQMTLLPYPAILGSDSGE